MIAVACINFMRAFTGGARRTEDEGTDLCTPMNQVQDWCDGANRLTSAELAEQLAKIFGVFPESDKRPVADLEFCRPADS
jgi:hypothetical protein